MMRLRFISPIFLITLLACVVSCETDPIIFQGPYFVRFTDIELTKKESYAKPILVEVHNAGPDPDHDVTITYTIGGTAREGVDYMIIGERGQVEIESGDYFGTIELQLINNANNILRSQDLVLTLVTVDTKGLQIGQGVSAIGKSFTLTIQDDCILGGNYYGIQTAADIPITGITVTSNNCKEYVLSNFDIYLFQFSEPRDLLFIDNDDNTLTIPPQEESTFNPEFATIDGSGVIDPTTRVITFTVRFVDIDEQPTHTFKLIPD